jgi:tRNA-dihydrouridine synthase C
VADPGLALAIRAAVQDERDAPLPGWSELQPLLHAFWGLIEAHIEPRHRAGRLKHWLNYLRKRYPEAEEAYHAVRTVTDSRIITAWLRQELDARPAHQPVTTAMPMAA